MTRTPIALLPPLRARLLCLLLAAGLAASATAATEGTTSDATLPQGDTPGSEADPSPAGSSSGAASPTTAPTDSPPAAGAAAPTADLPLAERCEAPEEVAPPQERLDDIAAAFANGPRPLRIVVLGSLSGQEGGGRGPADFAPQLQAILQAGLVARGADLPVQVQVVGRPRALVAALAKLIPREVLPLKPALVIWQVGRADPRQGNPPNRFGQSLKEGLALLRDAGIPTILGDIQFHPQFEALFRTDDYRNYVRWVAGKYDLPLLRRHEMIQHWAQSARIDLDSGDDADQKAAYGFIQECIAYQASRMILGAAGLVPVKRE